MYVNNFHGQERCSDHQPGKLAGWAEMRCLSHNTTIKEIGVIFQEELLLCRFVKRIIRVGSNVCVSCSYTICHITYQPTNQPTSESCVDHSRRSRDTYVCLCLCEREGGISCVCVSVKSQVRYGTITYALNAGRGEVIVLSRELMK